MKRNGFLAKSFYGARCFKSAPPSRKCAWIGLLLVLTGLFTAFDGTDEIDLTTLRNEDGDYAYHGIAWGSSPEEVENALGIDFADAMKLTSVSQEFCDYNFKNSARLNGYTASTSIEFIDDGLSSVHYSFNGEQGNLAVLYDTLADALTELYGEPDARVDEDDIADTISLPGGGALAVVTGRHMRRWVSTVGTETTLLIIQRVEINGKTEAVLSVNIVPSLP